METSIETLVINQYERDPSEMTGIAPAAGCQRRGEASRATRAAAQGFSDA